MRHVDRDPGPGFALKYEIVIWPMSQTIGTVILFFAMYFATVLLVVRRQHHGKNTDLVAVFLLHLFKSGRQQHAMRAFGRHDVDQQHLAAIVLQIVEVLVIRVGQRETGRAAVGVFARRRTGTARSTTDTKILAYSLTYQLPQRFRVRRPRHAALRDDRRDVAVRRHIERRDSPPRSFRRHRDAVHVRHF